MDDEQLNQRIRYLVEHGGVWDDPLAAMRRKLRWILGVVGALAVLQLVSVLHLIR